MLFAISFSTCNRVFIGKIFVKVGLGLTYLQLRLGLGFDVKVYIIFFWKRKLLQHFLRSAL
jgi:hypothetical protein